MPTDTHADIAPLVAMTRDSIRFMLDGWSRPETDAVIAEALGRRPGTSRHEFDISFRCVVDEGSDPLVFAGGVSSR